MHRTYLVLGLIAASLIPQVVNAQFFRRGGFRQQRVFRNYAPQQRTPIFQNQQGFGQQGLLQQGNGLRQQIFDSNGRLLNGQLQIDQQLQAARNLLNQQRQNQAAKNSRAVGQNRQNTNPSAVNNNRVPAQANREPGLWIQGEAQPMNGPATSRRMIPDQNFPRAPGAIQPPVVIQPNASEAKGTFSILEVPGEAKPESSNAEPQKSALEPVLEIPSATSDPQIIEETKTSLEIIAPPIEPIEEPQNNSILKIVDSKDKGADR
jgi:hypothetical protein